MSSSTPRKCSKCGRSCLAETRYCSFCGYRLSGVYLFFSYAHRDKELRDKLEKHLSGLKRRGLITTWHDRDINAGDEWGREVDIHLDEADVILLLISADFIATDYCYCKEMERALKRHEQGEARVVPVLLRPVHFSGVPFDQLQALPTNGRAVTDWRNRDGAFKNIAIGIEHLIQHHFTLPIPSFPAYQASPEYELSSLRYASPTPIPMSQDLSTYESFPIEEGSNASTVSGNRPLLTPPSLRVETLSNVQTCGLDLNLAQSGCKFGVNRRTILPALLRRLQLELHLVLDLITVVIAKSEAWVNKHPSQAHSHGFSNTRQTDVPKAPISDGYNLVSTIIFGFSRYLIPTMLSIPIQSLLFNRLLFFLFREVKRIKYSVEQTERQQIFTNLEYVKLFAKGELKTAYQTFLKRQYYGRAYRGKSNTLCSLELYDEALKAFTRAIDYNASPATYVSLGNTLAKIARYDEALVAYKRAIELDPTFATAYSDMADTLEQLGRNEEAQQAREKAKQYG